MKSLIKKFASIILFISAASFLNGCEETCPGVNFTDNTPPVDTTVVLDTTLNSQKKNVLLEEYTGVRCVNCPQGHVVAAGILNSYDEGRVVNVAIHTGNLAHGYTGISNYDFITQQGDDIAALVGPVGFFPSADISRKFFSAQGSRIIDKTLWAGKVAVEIQDTTPKVQMGLVKQYTDATRILNLKVQLQYTEDVVANNNLSVMLTESGMIEPQLDQSGIDTFYVHRHALRGMMTPSVGLPIGGSKIPNHPLLVSLPDFTIPASWNADSVHIVTFVTDTDSLNVLQVIENKLK